MGEKLRQVQTYAQKTDHQANLFALALLMPREPFLKAISGLDLSNDEGMKDICKMFGVTASAVAVRMAILAQMGYLKI